MRSVVDYSLARRATLQALARGQVPLSDVCDAHPYLLRAAKFHGEPTNEPCPVCRKELLTRVSYTYGDALGEYNGRIKATRELEEMEHEIHEFRVYVVEVCQGCAWNHLALTFVLGHGRAPQRSGGRRRTRADQLTADG
ncbi:MAG: DUF5318 family protein [Acidothermus cellulolyticus]|nr:DUF5318 family protein [Acidothermus cellulolyticus]